MNTRRIAPRLAAFAAVAVASFSGAAANAGTVTFSPGNSGITIVIVVGGKTFTFALTGVTQSGGAG